MNFYIGNEIEKITYNSDNIEIDNELMEFLYKLHRNNKANLNIFMDIDPYNNEIVNAKNVKNLRDEISTIILSDILDEYEDKEDALVILKKLVLLCDKAIADNAGMVSIGD